MIEKKCGRSIWKLVNVEKEYSDIVNASKIDGSVRRIEVE